MIDMDTAIDYMYGLREKISVTAWIIRGQE